MIETITGRRAQARRLLGALRSGHPAARLGMALAAARPLTVALDRLLRALPAQPPEVMPPCVMIASPPRSGSTVVYQATTRALRCVYISNLHMLLPALASRWMLRRERFAAVMPGFNNYYGHTPSIYDVNEGNALMQWVLSPGLDAAQVRRRFGALATWVGAASDRPLIYKNVWAYDQLARLRDAVPELWTVRLRRDPEQAIQSELKAHYELGTFNPIPAALRADPPADPVSFAVRQMLAVERTIDAQLAQAGESRVVRWSYEAFCAEPRRHVLALAESLGMDERGLRFDPAELALRASMDQKVDRAELEAIRAMLASRPEGPPWP